MPITQEQLIDHLGSMTVMEMTALTRELEDRWGVSATPQVTTITTTPLELGEEERTEFDVILESFGEKKINVIKTVRQMTPGLGLKEAKELVESAPATVRESVSKEEAEEIKRQLEEAGATIQIK